MKNSNGKGSSPYPHGHHPATTRRPPAEDCHICKGRGYLMRWTRRGGRAKFVPAECGRCYGSGIEPVVSLRELQARNQQRIREERNT